LTLRAVCGLTTAEIAAAFLVGEPAMTQRLLRARKALRAAGADMRIPDPDQLADRLAEVLAVVYLVFNEGYLASAGRQPARRDLAAQAVALARLLHRLMPREPEVLGLLALMLLHESRAATRFDGWGRLVRLADQDRSRWNTEGPEAALAEIEPLAGELDGYRLFHALRAGLLTGLGRDDEARQASERALALAGNPAERELLARRLSF